MLTNLKPSQKISFGNSSKPISVKDFNRYLKRINTLKNRNMENEQNIRILESKIRGEI